MGVPRELVARVRAGGFAPLLTGPPGRGKTAHLPGLAPGPPGAIREAGADDAPPDADN